MSSPSASSRDDARGTGLEYESEAALTARLTDAAASPAPLSTPQLIALYMQRQRRAFMLARERPPPLLRPAAAAGPLPRVALLGEEAAVTALAAALTPLDWQPLLARTGLCLTRTSSNVGGGAAGSSPDAAPAAVVEAVALPPGEAWDGARREALLWADAVLVCYRADGGESGGEESCGGLDKVERRWLPLLLEAARALRSDDACMSACTSQAPQRGLYWPLGVGDGGGSDAGTNDKERASAPPALALAPPVALVGLRRRPPLPGVPPGVPAAAAAAVLRRALADAGPGTVPLLELHLSSRAQLAALARRCREWRAAHVRTAWHGAARDTPLRQLMRAPPPVAAEEEPREDSGAAVVRVVMPPHGLADARWWYTLTGDNPALLLPTELARAAAVDAQGRFLIPAAELEAAAVRTEGCESGAATPPELRLCATARGLYTSKTLVLPLARWWSTCRCSPRPSSGGHGDGGTAVACDVSSPEPKPHPGSAGGVDGEPSPRLSAPRQQERLSIHTSPSASRPTRTDSAAAAAAALGDHHPHQRHQHFPAWTEGGTPRNGNNKSQDDSRSPPPSSPPSTSRRRTQGAWDGEPYYMSSPAAGYRETRASLLREAYSCGRYEPPQLPFMTFRVDPGDFPAAPPPPPPPRQRRHFYYRLADRPSHGDDTGLVRSRGPSEPPPPRRVRAPSPSLYTAPRVPHPTNGAWLRATRARRGASEDGQEGQPTAAAATAEANEGWEGSYNSSSGSSEDGGGLPDTIDGWHRRPSVSRAEMDRAAVANAFSRDRLAFAEDPVRYLASSSSSSERDGDYRRDYERRAHRTTGGADVVSASDGGGVDAPLKQQQHQPRESRVHFCFPDADPILLSHLSVEMSRTAAVTLHSHSDSNAGGGAGGVSYRLWLRYSASDAWVAAGSGVLAGPSRSGAAGPHAAIIRPGDGGVDCRQTPVTQVLCCFETSPQALWVVGGVKVHGRPARSVA